MDATIAPEHPIAVVGETINFRVSFDLMLDSGETVTGTPTVAQEGGSGLNISGQAVNSAAIEVNGVDVATGKVVLCTVAGFDAADVSYTIKITVVTSAGQTRVRRITFPVEA